MDFIYNPLHFELYCKKYVVILPCAYSQDTQFALTL
jgi:hypothetical protein